MIGLALGRFEGLLIDEQGNLVIERSVEHADQQGQGVDLGFTQRRVVTEQGCTSDATGAGTQHVEVFTTGNGEDDIDGFFECVDVSRQAPFTLSLGRVAPADDERLHVGAQAEARQALIRAQVEDIEFVDDYFSYQYESKKPFKTLPSKDLIRVFDVIPVKALSQEIISNRLVYGNFQDKHTPPDTINYSVNVGAKKPFNLQNGTAIADSQTDSTTIQISSNTGTILVGSIITNLSSGGNPVVVTDLDDILTEITVSGPVTIVPFEELIFEAAADDTQYTSTVENPNHTVKQNRNYQVGIVLSDRFGRQSSVIVSKDSILSKEDGDEFIGSTIYSPYQTTAVEQNEWPGDSLKVLFNDPIGPANPNTTTGWPGLYNGDPTSLSYNPLGWYSYKVVVKQTEQEYYNVYLPGIMAAYPESTTLEIGNTSHAVLINDNINKVPRDLNEVGPDQKQFRSSVRLFGRVENTSTEITYIGTIPQDVGLSNDQYFPGRESDTVSTISTLNDLFNYDPNDPPRPDYFPQFYSFLSNPLVARISTDDKIGQTATTNFDTASALVEADVSSSSTVNLKNVVGDINPSMVVFGGGLPADSIVILWTPGATSDIGVLTFDSPVTLKTDAVLTFAQGFPSPNYGTIVDPGIQYLAVYETEPRSNNRNRPRFQRWICSLLWRLKGNYITQSSKPI